MNVLRFVVKAIGFVLILANVLLVSAPILILLPVISGAAKGESGGGSDNGLYDAILEGSWIGAELFATFLLGGPMARPPLLQPSEL